MTSIVHVEVSGLTGSGKSAVMGEIEIALKALGLKVEHGPDFQAEKNATHADWQEALDLYQPTVVLAERNISRQPEAREEALGNLLAVIHGDGGHRALEVGTKQAALEAEKIVAGLFAAPSADKLREFGQHTNLELSYHYSEEGDNDGWQVHQVNGGVNDREWTLMGSGDTPADAIDQALAALSTPDALKGGAKP